MSAGPRDHSVIAGQLGRPPRNLTGIPARCPFGYPAVIETAPVLEDGSPNPTLLYLTCPSLVTAVSRAEAAGGVRAFKAACRADPRLCELIAQITQAYRERRAVLLEGLLRPGARDPRLEAGIGGPETPEAASCLHAYAAAFLAARPGWFRLNGEPAVPGSDRAGLGESAYPVPSEGVGLVLPESAGLVLPETAGAGLPEGVGPASPENADAGPRVDIDATWNRFLPPLVSSWCVDASCARWAAGERRAAIDVGTISVRLLVADVLDQRPVSLLRQAEVTRLGEGLVPGGSLHQAAKKRTSAVVARFAEEARRLGALSIVLAGTSAAREACDGAEFIATLGRDHGLDALVLSGQQEAALAYRGAALDVSGSPVLLDVGGGSTELTIGAEEGGIRAVSLPLGASRCTEQWVQSDPPAFEEMAAVREEAARRFAEVRAAFGADAGTAPGAAGKTARRLVGVAGTVTTLAALDGGLQEYDAAAIHLRTLSLQSVRELGARLGRLSTVERAALPCMQTGRAPVIVAGAIIVMAAMETLGYDELVVSERDLLDGLVLAGPAGAAGGPSLQVYSPRPGPD